MSVIQHQTTPCPFNAESWTGPCGLLPSMLLNIALFVQAIAGVTMSLLALFFTYLFPACAPAPPPMLPSDKLSARLRSPRRLSADSTRSHTSSSSEDVITPPSVQPSSPESPTEKTARHQPVLPTVLETSESREPSSSSPRQSYFLSPLTFTSPFASSSPSAPSSDANKKRSFKLPKLKINAPKPKTRKSTGDIPETSCTSKLELHASTSTPCKPRLAHSRSADRLLFSPKPSSATSPACPNRRHSSFLSSADNAKSSASPLKPSTPSSKRPVARTDPYAAPFFFPSPHSPRADEYVTLVRQEKQAARRMESASTAAAAPAESLPVRRTLMKRHSFFSGQSKRTRAEEGS